MRKTSLALPVLLLSLATLPLACSQSPNGQSTGSGGAGGRASGGSGSGGATGGGGSSAKGGSGGSSAGTGGSSAETGGSTTETGGRTTGTGGNATGTGGSTAGTGGSAGAGGGSSDKGGSSGGGAGGSEPGGAGGSSPGGPAGAGGAAGSGGTDGGSDDAGPMGGDDAQADASPAPSCTDKTTNGDETDTDCGGGTCPKCRAGKTCKTKDDCTSGGCTGGKCDDPFAATAPVANPNNANIWSITIGTLVFEVRLGGAMIQTFSLDGTNVLVTNNESNGSVFWIAPQSEWNANGWPPPSEMDENATYAASSQDNVLTMALETAGSDGFSITKRFWGNAERQAITIEYTIKNGSTSDVKKAPWEISRVYPGGLTFFPTAETPVVLPGTNNAFVAVPFTTSGGVAWYKYQKSDLTQSDIKSGANGLEGWATQINCGPTLEQACASGAKSIAFIKEWPDSTTEAPGEKEVELYAKADHIYVEFEQQGDYQTIPAGGTVVWTMHWMLRDLPSDIDATPGNADLATWVRGQLL